MTVGHYTGFGPLRSLSVHEKGRKGKQRGKGGEAVTQLTLRAAASLAVCNLLQFFLRSNTIILRWSHPVSMNFAFGPPGLLLEWKRHSSDLATPGQYKSTNMSELTDFSSSSCCSSGLSEPSALVECSLRDDEKDKQRYLLPCLP